MSDGAKKEPRIIGWREWLGLPGLGVEAIKAKVDTGARSSALHAFDIERFRRKGADWVRFVIHPRQRETKTTIFAEARLFDERHVRSSSGARELRPVIVTDVLISGEIWPIELTLTNRDEMGFRMLLGREALRRRFLVDPSRSYVQSKKKKTKKKSARLIERTGQA